MSRRAARHFQTELDLLVDRFRVEYQITDNEMIRALETTSEELIEKVDSNDAALTDEDDADPDDA